MFTWRDGRPLESVSRDLVHWTDREWKAPGKWATVAVDGPSLVALLDEGQGSLEPAISRDDGASWKRLGKVLSWRGMKDARLVRAGGQWILLGTVAGRPVLKMWESADLRNWRPLDDFHNEAAGPGEWGSPDLFPMGSEWVLTVGVRGHGVSYFVGDWGKRGFSRKSSGGWMELGEDCGMAAFNAPAGDPRRLWIGAMGGRPTFPRELLLRDGVHLAQRPAPEIALLHGTEFGLRDCDAAGANAELKTLGARWPSFELVMAGRFRPAEEFGVTVNGAAGEAAKIAEKASGEWFVERRGTLRQAAAAVGDSVRLHLVARNGAIQGFAGDGSTVITVRAELSGGDVRVWVKPDGSRMEWLKFWELR